MKLLINSIINNQNPKTMSNARLQAERDIKEDLKKESKVFIPYFKVLNPIMKELIRQHITAQKKLNIKKKLIMCWITYEKPIPKIASKDIEVYKIFKMCEGKAYSPIRGNFFWNPRVPYTTFLEEPFYYDHLAAWSINRGFHSLMLPPKIIKAFFSNGAKAWFAQGIFLFSAHERDVVLKCIIPKNSKYYINDNGEIVSESLILLSGEKIKVKVHRGNNNRILT